MSGRKTSKESSQSWKKKRAAKKNKNHEKAWVSEWKTVQSELELWRREQRKGGRGRSEWEWKSSNCFDLELSRGVTQSKWVMNSMHLVLLWEYSHCARGFLFMTTWKKQRVNIRQAKRGSGTADFTASQGNCWTEKVDWRGSLKARKTKETELEIFVIELRQMDSGLCDLSTGWCLWPVIYWTLEKDLAREALTLLFFMLLSISLQQLWSFPAKNTLTGFSCSLNFHKACFNYRKICHILKWLVK